MSDEVLNEIEEEIKSFTKEELKAALEFLNFVEVCK